MDEKIYRPGHFVWRELITTDVAKAVTFYTQFLGWKATEMQTPNGTYTIVTNGTQQIAGIMNVPPHAPAMSFWQSYVSVNDVDRAVQTAGDLGGRVLMPALDAPNVGRFATLADPTGAVFSIIRQANGDGPAAMPPAGSFCWESYNATDAAKGIPFYEAVVGWTEKTEHGMSVLLSGESMVADVGSAPAGMPAHWLTHVVVTQLETSRDQAEKLGAKIVMPLIPVPGIGRLAVIQDPTGAYLSLFEGSQAAPQS